VWRVFDRVRFFVLSPLGIAFFTVCCFVAAHAATDWAGVELGYGFLRWNLFLAWIPLGLAYALSWALQRDAAWVALPTLAAAWIVFLPNAPYLVTDLVHVHDDPRGPNVIALGILAFTGLLIGVKSVLIVHRAVERVLGVKAGRHAVQLIAVLTAFGVYLGRVKRWNSWTLLSHPDAVTQAILRSPSEPARLGLALLGTMAFALAFYAVYRVLTDSGRERAELAAVRARGGSGA
jgi:uncharacterized membrane protein